MSKLNVESSVIEAVEANGDNLIVNFKNGSSYTYEGAAKELSPLSDADSKGRYFLENIKKNYSFSRN
tara:strand:- start:714 stop:914 length:201 start_codon:yes stop_codon:yes gene_type:complete